MNGKSSLTRSPQLRTWSDLLRCEISIFMSGAGRWSLLLTDLLLMTSTGCDSNFEELSIVFEEVSSGVGVEVGIVVGASLVVVVISDVDDFLLRVKTLLVVDVEADSSSPTQTFIKCIFVIILKIFMKSFEKTKSFQQK